MKGEINMLLKIGLFIYVIYLLMDRFVIAILDIIAIPIMIIGVVMIIIGSIKTPKGIVTE